MNSEILRCKKCGEYSLDERCDCGGECLTPKPHKWSPEDKYSKYRIKYKENEGK